MIMDDYGVANGRRFDSRTGVDAENILHCHLIHHKSQKT
jgi:hypothetical protein